MTRTRVVAPAALAAAVLAVALAPSPSPTPGPGPGRIAAAPSLKQPLDDETDHGGAPLGPALAAVSCPIERGPVKEGSDADRYRVSTTITATSVAYLVSRPKPSSYPNNNRLVPYERMTWQLTATLLQYKQESDGDVHLVVQDSAGCKMIAELPYSPCVPASSRWQAAIAAARASFTHTYTPTTSWHYVRRIVTLKGLALFDPPHGQTGAAGNGIELHPVTAVTFH